MREAGGTEMTEPTADALATRVFSLTMIGVGILLFALTILPHL